MGARHFSSRTRAPRPPVNLLSHLHCPMVSYFHCSSSSTFWRVALIYFLISRNGFLFLSYSFSTLFYSFYIDRNIFFHLSGYVNKINVLNWFILARFSSLHYFGPLSTGLLFVCLHFSLSCSWFPSHGRWSLGADMDFLCWFVDRPVCTGASSWEGIPTGALLGT